MNSDEPNVDKAGQPIKVGSKVAYGIRSGNYGDIRLGVVTEIVQTAHGWGNFVQPDGNGKPRNMLGRLLVVYK